MPDINNFFIVNKNRVVSSNIQYTVFLLKDRIIFMKTGGQMADTDTSSIKLMLIGAAIGGFVGGYLIGVLEKASGSLLLGSICGLITMIIGGVIGHLIDKKNYKFKVAEMAERIDRMKEMTEEQMLDADKANFAIRNDEIASWYVKKSKANFLYQTPRSGVLKITTFNEKPQIYDISIKSDFDMVTLQLYEALPYKFKVV